jgi:hypothetical protein
MNLLLRTYAVNCGSAMSTNQLASGMNIIYNDFHRYVVEMWWFTLQANHLDPWVLLLCAIFFHACGLGLPGGSFSIQAH